MTAIALPSSFLPSFLPSFFPSSLLSFPPKVRIKLAYPRARFRRSRSEMCGSMEIPTKKSPAVRTITAGSRLLVTPYTSLTALASSKTFSCRWATSMPSINRPSAASNTSKVSFLGSYALCSTAWSSLSRFCRKLGKSRRRARLMLRSCLFQGFSSFFTVVSWHQSLPKDCFLLHRSRYTIPTTSRTFTASSPPLQPFRERHLGRARHSARSHGIK